MGEQGNEGIREQLERACATAKGMLMLINLDNFQIFYDVYGDEISNELISGVFKALDDNTGINDIIGNVGRDAFIVFSSSITDQVTFSRLYGNLKNKLSEYGKQLVGEDMKISLGVSVGVVMVPEEGTDFEELFQKANSALESVKITAVSGCAFYGNTDALDQGAEVDHITTVSRGLDETGEHGALWLDYDQFSIVYRYIKRYIQTYKTKAVKMLITIHPVDVMMTAEELDAITREFGMVANLCLRKSDIMMQSRGQQYFLLLPEMDDNYITKTYARIMNRWQSSPNFYKVRMTYEAESITMPQ